MVPFTNAARSGVVVDFVPRMVAQRRLLMSLAAAFAASAGGLSNARRPHPNESTVRRLTCWITSSGKFLYDTLAAYDPIRSEIFLSLTVDSDVFPDFSP